MFENSIESLSMILAERRHYLEAKVINTDNLTVLFCIDIDVVIEIVCAVEVGCKLKQAFCKLDPISAYLLKKILLLETQNATYLLSIHFLKVVVEILVDEQGQDSLRNQYYFVFVEAVHENVLAVVGNHGRQHLFIISHPDDVTHQSIVKVFFFLKFRKDCHYQVSHFLTPFLHFFQIRKHYYIDKQQRSKECLCCQRRNCFSN